MLYSAAYEIPYVFAQTDPNDPIDYSIVLSRTGQVIYTGQVWSKSTTEPAKIDLAPIFREYLDTFYEEIDWNSAQEMPAKGIIADNQQFKVVTTEMQTGFVSFQELALGQDLKGATITIDTSQPLPTDLNRTASVSGYGWSLVYSPGGSASTPSLYFATFGTQTYLYNGGQWRMSEFTFPTDTEYIYTSNNNLFSSTDTAWGWDMIGMDITREEVIEKIYDVMYDYNTDYEYILPDIDNRSYLISNTFDPRQFLTFSKYVTSPQTQEAYILYKASGMTKVWESYHIKIDHSAYFGVNCNSLDLTPGEVYGVTRLNNPKSIKLTCLKPCLNRFCLYYVNKAGGLDWLVCKGVIHWDRTEVNGRFRNNRLDRRDFEKSRIGSRVEKRYELETPLLSNEKSPLIDNLINSPKIWIQDLSTGEVTSCLINTTTIKELTYPRDNELVYKFSITESQQYFRK